MKKLVIFSITLLWAVAVIAGEDLMDQVFGEALLKSLSPSLREKLEEIHSTGVLKNKSESQMARLVKLQLTPEEIKEMEAAYKRLILPMLQNTLEKRLGRKYEHLDDIPIEFEDDEEVESAEVDDFKTESEELSERKIRENKAKDKNDKKGDSPRTVNIEKSDKRSGSTDTVTTEKSEKLEEAKNYGKGKNDRVKKANDKNRAKEEL